MGSIPGKSAVFLMKKVDVDRFRTSSVVRDDGSVLLGAKVPCRGSNDHLLSDRANCPLDRLVSAN